MFKQLWKFQLDSNVNWYHLKKLINLFQVWNRICFVEYRYHVLFKNNRSSWESIKCKRREHVSIFIPIHSATWMVAFICRVCYLSPHHKLHSATTKLPKNWILLPPEFYCWCQPWIEYCAKVKIAQTEILPRLNTHKKNDAKHAVSDSQFCSCYTK